MFSQQCESRRLLSWLLHNACSILAIYQLSAFHKSILPPSELSPEDGGGSMLLCRVTTAEISARLGINVIHPWYKPHLHIILTRYKMTTVEPHT